MALNFKFFNRKKSSSKMNGWLALSPLFVFMTIYLISAVVAGDIYAVPVSVAFIFACVYAFIITHRHETTTHTLEMFSSGAGDQNILLMIWVVVLAGAFASTSKSIGSIDAVTDLITAYLSGPMLYVGLFIASCLISMAIGTNIGTIVALVPIVVGVAEKTDYNLAFMAAIVVGGGSFGDNLSFISDTTIAATSLLGCEMKDKFRANIRIVTPAAFIVALIYIVMGIGVEMPHEAVETIHWTTLIPYFVTILLASLGINVVTVLTFGILLNGVIGIIIGNYTALDWMRAISEGVVGMNELILVMMMAGGMLEIVRYNGGIDFLVNKITSRVSGKRGAEFSIAAMVSAATFATANNTIAILTTGKIAKNICEKHNLNPIKVASILDTFSCSIQSILPYGMHVLMASALAEVSVLSIIKNLYYPLILLVVASVAILLRLPKKYS